MPTEVEQRQQWIGLVFLLAAGGVSLAALLLASVAFMGMRTQGKEIATAQATADAAGSFCADLPAFVFRADRDRERAAEQRSYLMNNSYDALRFLGMKDVKPPPEALPVADESPPEPIP